MRKYVSLFLSFVMLISLASVSGASTQKGLYGTSAALSSGTAAMGLLKDETVYVSIGYEGAVDKTSIVNRIQTPAAGYYTDFGSYSEIKNLTNELAPATEGNKIIWDLPALEKGFYYEGSLKEAQLPFNLSIDYFLDGKILKAEELLGKTGKVDIKLSVTANEKANEYFKDHYMAQVQLPLSFDFCKNIVAEGAQSVITGSTNTLAFMVLPGMSKAFDISFDTNGFQMDGLTATFMSVDMQSLVGMDAQGMEDGAKKLSEGTDELVNGTEQLKGGIAEIVNGMKKSTSGLTELISGNLEFRTGLEAYLAGIVTISQNTDQLSQGLGKLGQSGSDLYSGYTQLTGGTVQLLDSLIATLPPEQQELYGAQAALLKQQLQGYGDNLNTYTQGVSRSAQGLTALSAGLSNAAQQSASLVNGAAEIHDGLTQISNGFNSLYQGIKTVPSEIQKLIDGQKQLSEGVNEALSQLDGLNLSAGGLGNPVSFADHSQTVNSVQFIVKTPELKIKTETPPLATEAKTMSFWEKLVALFQ